MEGGMTTVWKHSLGLFTTASKVSLPAASREGDAGSVVWAAERHLKNGPSDKHCLRVCSMPDTVSEIRGQVNKVWATVQDLVIQQEMCLSLFILYSMYVLEGHRRMLVPSSVDSTLAP